MIDAEIDSSQFWGLLQAMDGKARVRVMRATLRRAANDLKGRAFDVLTGKLRSLRNRTAMRKTIWTKVYDRTPGFRVTVAGNAHTYPSRMTAKGGATRELPLARWLEDGTGQRTTRTGGHARGSLPALKFLETANAGLKDRITDMLEEKFIGEMTRIAKNYGCI